MKVAYICTNFNNSEFTREAARSFFETMGDAPAEMVVVDNASVARHRELLKELEAEFAHLRVIFNDANAGYFEGLNIGIRSLDTVASYDWVIIGNNDLEFPQEFAQRLQQNSARLGQHAVISPDVITLDGEHQNPHVIARISGLREMVYDLYYASYPLAMLIQHVARWLPRLTERSDEKQWQIAQPIYQGHGSVYLLSARFFQTFEALWAPTFLMGEEFFLSKQLSDRGMQVYYDPQVQVRHHWHASLAKLPSRARWQMARDAHRVYRQHVPRWRSSGV